MSTEIENQDTQTLGEYLRLARKEKGLKIEELAEETKISLINLHAMESDDFDALPPVTFARGLYTIYAKVLEIDADEVLARYSKESNTNDKDQAKPTPTRLSREVGAMAERPPAPPTSLFGIVFIIFIILIALGCWYYSINPATFISEKLRGLQETSTEKVVTEQQPEQEQTIVSTTGEATAQPEENTVQETAVKYTLEAYFPDFTMVLITIDDSRQQQLSMMAGQKITWKAHQALELTLPEDTTTALTLNGSKIALPAPENGAVSLFIPEYLFE